MTRLGHDGIDTTESEFSNCIIPDNPEAEAFVRGLVERGQAGRRDQAGQLQPGVTHEILGTVPNGLPIVREIRKAAF
jgi:hypothetical protein